jgi:hypothetical protein
MLTTGISHLEKNVEFLSNGRLLRKHKILNSSLLVLEQDEIISSSLIEKIELE